VAEYKANCIKQIDLNEKIVKVYAGFGNVGFCDGDALKKALFFNPTDICIGPSQNQSGPSILYVSDYNNNRIRWICESSLKEMPQFEKNSIYPYSNNTEIAHESPVDWFNKAFTPIYTHPPASSQQGLPQTQHQYLPTSQIGATQVRSQGSSYQVTPSQPMTMLYQQQQSHPTPSNESLEDNEVLNWLCSINLGHFYAHLLNLGISDIDSLQYLDESDLGAEFKIIEKRKLFANIRKLYPSTEKSVEKVEKIENIEEQDNLETENIKNL